jgi:dephospho-CoA kinase
LSTLEVPNRLLVNVAFMGRMGSGKTTAAEILERGYGYTRVSFAKALKDIAVQLWGPGAVKDRGLMQQFGMKMREVDPSVWVTVARDRIDGLIIGGLGPVVNDDLRFPNEFHALRKLGFVIVKVCAHEGQRINRLTANGKLQDREQMNDVSETALDGAVADYTLINTTDLQDLQDALVDIVEREARRRA